MFRKQSSDQKNYFEIRVHFKATFGYGVFITGDSEQLGNKHHAHRMTCIGDNLWVFQMEGKHKGDVTFLYGAYGQEAEVYPVIGPCPYDARKFMFSNSCHINVKKGDTVDFTLSRPRNFELHAEMFHCPVPVVGPGKK